jgi:hypothetical protein
MSNFHPPINQVLLSNTESYPIEMQEHVIQMIVNIGNALYDSGLVPYSNPVDNCGQKYEGPTFAIRSYCWCEGDDHPNGCPPNFEWRDFKCSWYKYIGRGSSQNREMSEEEAKEMGKVCIQEIMEKRAYG